MAVAYMGETPMLRGRMLSPKFREAVPGDRWGEVMGEMEMRVAQEPAEDRRKVEVAGCAGARIVRRGGDDQCEEGSGHEQRNDPGEEENEPFAGEDEDSGDDNRQQRAGEEMSAP